jgi:hypothetical protein
MEGHRCLLDIRAFLGEEKRSGLEHLAREVEARQGDDGFAAGRESVDREARQAAVPTVDGVRIGDAGMLPQRIAGRLQLSAA